MADVGNKKKEEKLYVKQEAVSWVFMWFIFFIAWIVSIVFVWTNTTLGWILLLLFAGIVGLAGTVVPVVYFGLAPLNVFWTLVEEGTVKIVMAGGGFKEALLQWGGHAFDKKGNVVPVGWCKNGKPLDVIEVLNGKAGTVKVRVPQIDQEEHIIGATDVVIQDAEFCQEEKHLLGGLRFYGLWPFTSIYKYNFRWTSVRESGEFMPHEEVLDKISVKDFIYGAELKAAETKDQIPVDVLFVIGLRVEHPRKALFNVQDWLEKIINTIKALLREYIAATEYQTALADIKNIGNKIRAELKESEIVDRFYDDYGVHLIPDEIKVKDITPPKAYQKGAAKKIAAEWEQDRVVGETMGSLIKMLGLQPGASLKNVEDTIKDRPQAAEIAKDFIHRRMGIDGGAYVDVRVPGTSAVGAEIIKILAAWQRMPKGGGGKEGEKKEEEEEEKEESSGGGKEERDKDKEGEGKETSSPVQSFWSTKKPMEKIHRWKRKRKK